MNPPREERLARLLWSPENDVPCYVSENPYPLDVTRIDATALCLAHTFGVSSDDIAAIEVTESSSGKEVSPVDGKYPLEPQKEYSILLSAEASTKYDKRLPISQIFSLVPGATEDEQSDRLQALSNNFYEKIWHADHISADFRKSFVNPMSSYEIQAYRQFNWFCEVMGGPTMYDEKGEGERYYKPRTMAKHTASRMTLEHSLTWLKLMRTTLDETMSDAPEFQAALEVYWLHFYAMFPFSDQNRREFERVMLQARSSGKDGQEVNGHAGDELAET